MNFKEKSVVVNGCKTFYWEKNVSPKSDTKKETIILLHGFPGTHDGIIDVANSLGNYHMIIPDLPACGLSEPLKAKHNLENYSQWLYDFLESLSIGQVSIVGHSFGSRIALVFNDCYAKKVKHLVLITPVVKFEGLFDRFASMYYEAAEVLPGYMQKIMLSNGFGKKMGDLVIFKSADARIHKKIIDRDIREIKKIDPKISIEIFDEFYKFSLIPTGKKIKTKSLVIASDSDMIAPLNSVRELVIQISDVKLEIMKNCGHLVPLEKPLLVAGVIKKWLAESQSA